jgi:hypothetical protein
MRRFQFYNLPACQIPWWQGKMQGISPIQPLFAKIGLENTCKYNSVRDNSLCDRAGNFFARAGNYSAFWTGAGNLGKIDPRFGALRRPIIPANTRKDAATLLASDPRAA